MKTKKLKKIGPYQILNTLSKEESGSVYLARESKSYLCYAIKSSINREHLRKEYRILRLLNSKMNFINIYEYGAQEEYDYIVMEHLGSKLDFFMRSKVLSLECVSAIGLEILDSLEKIHNNGIVHRNIKPSQITVSRSKYKINIVDFGMATFYIENSNA